MRLFVLRNQPSFDVPRAAKCYFAQAKSVINVTRVCTNTLFMRLRASSENVLSGSDEVVSALPRGKDEAP